MDFLNVLIKAVCLVVAFFVLHQAGTALKKKRYVYGSLLIVLGVLLAVVKITIQH